MGTLRLHDSQKGRKMLFAPLDPERVRLYLCGPTVYDRAHIGNARPVIVFDVLFRLLRLRYGAANVIYVRNITDVDDKINARAAETGTSIETITETTVGWFHEDVRALNALPPTHEPRATAHIAPMIAMIARLIARGFAYEAAGHVLFHVPAFKDYGALSRRSAQDMQAGARVEVAPYKRDPMDFILWKPSRADLPGWNSPWGRGRPGWHIECSAMSNALLGADFDIHAGGIDLQFPHHENERAQSLCASEGSRFARFWLHNGTLLVAGEKMAKSLGNVITIRGLIENGASGEAIRLAMLMSHYRQPLDWTQARLQEAEEICRRWGEILKGCGDVAEEKAAGESALDGAALAALEDDLNTPKAMARLHILASEAQGGERGAAQAFGATLALMGLPARTLARRGAEPSMGATERARIVSLIGERERARAARNFARADAIRTYLMQAGVALRDAGKERGATSWRVGARYDPEALRKRTPWEKAP